MEDVVKLQHRSGQVMIFTDLGTSDSFTENCAPKRITYTKHNCREIVFLSPTVMPQNGFVLLNIRNGFFDKIITWVLEFAQNGLIEHCGPCYW